MGAVTVEQFRETLSGVQPPELPSPLRALWYDAKGDWERAHTIAQDVEDASGSWVHAYLHRKEGDLGNAAYWYRRAHQAAATDSLQNEWTRIVQALLRSIP